MTKLSVRDLDVKSKRVLVRVDFNVPLDGERVTDDTRITTALPTIQYLQQAGAAVVLMSHLGRPKGQVNPKYSLMPAARRLGELLGQPVSLLPDCVGPTVEAAVRQVRPGEVVSLENLRFHPEEEANDPDFARALSALGDVYVNDAFGAAHRAHASTEGVTRYLPAAAGLLMERELDALGRALSAPDRPLVTILGGAKVSDKIAAIENLLDKVDTLILGGGMANTFLAATGHPVGKSLVEPSLAPLALDLLERARTKRVTIALPIDVVVATDMSGQAPTQAVFTDAVPPDTGIFDIGPATARHYRSLIEPAKTVIWNGPMGVFEVAPFAAGTKSVALAVAACAGFTVVGGGDSVAAIEQLGLGGQMSHVSTGGGASLEFLEGRELPGVAALNDKR